MKKFLVAVLSFVTLTAFAADVTALPTGVTVSGSNDQRQQQDSTSTAVASPTANAANAGNHQTINFISPGVTENTTRVEYSGSQTVKNVPSMGAPSLTTSNNMCVGSVSAALAVPGFGGAYAKTIKDEHCIIIKSSGHLWEKGMRAASMAVDCMDPQMREALELTGFECPQSRKERLAARDKFIDAAYGSKKARETAPGYTGNDEIVIRRLTK